MNKKHWISVYFNQDVPDKEIKELVKKSYDICNFGTYPRNLYTNGIGNAM